MTLHTEFGTGQNSDLASGRLLHLYARISCWNELTSLLLTAACTIPAVNYSNIPTQAVIYTAPAGI